MVAVDLTRAASHPRVAPVAVRTSADDLEPELARSFLAAKRALSEAGRRRAALFSWDEAAAATAQVLRRAAGLEQTGSDEYRV